MYETDIIIGVNIYNVLYNVFEGEVVIEEIFDTSGYTLLKYLVNTDTLTIIEELTQEVYNNYIEDYYEGGDE